MNLRASRRCMYVSKYEQRGPVVESGPDTAARGQERETEGEGEQERKTGRARERGGKVVA